MVGKTRSGRPSRRQAGFIAVVFVAIGAITLNLALQNTAPKPAASAGPNASTGLPASAGPSAPPSQPSTAPEAQWAPLQLAPSRATATLEPSAEDTAGIPAATTFTLASLTDEPASALAARLEVTPSTPFEVVPSVDGKAATITPTTALAAGHAYRFALRSPDGTVAASWAFQVRGPVNVTTTIPGDATTGVPVRTGIEVTFDQEGVADMADHFLDRTAGQRHVRTAWPDAGLRSNRPRGRDDVHGDGPQGVGADRHGPPPCCPTSSSASKPTARLSRRPGSSSDAM